MTIDEQCNSLYNKLLALLQKLQRRERELAAVQAELDALKASYASSDQTIAALKQRISVMQLALGDMPALERKAFEKTISRYIADVDRAIAHLSK